MEITLYNKILETKISGIPISKVSSWAIWNKENQTDVEYIKSNIDKLNPSIVFVGLNWGGSEIKKIINKNEWDKLIEWKNFHSPSRGDKNLMEILNNTRYEGAYMTDLFKNMMTKDAGDFYQKIKDRIITKDDIQKQIEIFIEEMESLHTQNIEMYLFGNDTKKYFDKYIVGNNLWKLKKIITFCQKIDHFSPQNTRFKKKVKEQLRLVKSTEPIDLLWNEK
jgi:hypothetical protein